MKKSKSYHVILESHSDGIWTAEIPAFGIVTEGRGERGALRAAREAVEGWVEVAARRGVAIPPPDAIAVDLRAKNQRRRSA